MPKTRTYVAFILYRYDGETNDTIVDVEATSKKGAREAAKLEARRMLEEGIRFTVPMAHIRTKEDWMAQGMPCPPVYV